MENYLDNLKIKFNYSDDMIRLLNSVIPAIIRIFGEEHTEMIFSAINECEIHIQGPTENTQDYLNTYFNTQEKWQIPTTGGAFYHKNIKITETGLESKSIVYIRTPYKKEFVLDNNKLDTIVHELCHAIKGYKKEKLINGKVYDSTGLNKDICDIENGKIEVKETSMLGIEEVLNSVTTAKICKLITGEYQIKSYGRASRIAELLLQNDELKKLLFRAQFKEDNEWIEYLGEENAKIICENLDTLVNAMYAPWGEVNTPEKRKAHNERLNKLCEETYDFTSEILKSKSL